MKKRVLSFHEAYPGSINDLDAYIKVELSRRFKTVAGQVVQRDLYSAFLQSCMGTPEKPGKEKCLQLLDSL